MDHEGDPEVGSHRDRPLEEGANHLGWGGGSDIDIRRSLFKKHVSNRAPREIGGIAGLDEPLDDGLGFDFVGSFCHATDSAKPC